MPIKRILIPVDFSVDSLNALRYGGEFAKPFAAEICLLYVIEPIYYATPADMYVATSDATTLLDEQRRIGVEQLQRLTDELKEKGFRSRGLVETGAPAHVIVQAAIDHHVDLIVMGTHGRTGLAHMLMGSVAEKVVRTAKCPVLTVRHGVASHPEPAKKPAS